MTNLLHMGKALAVSMLQSIPLAPVSRLIAREIEALDIGEGRLVGVGLSLEARSDGSVIVARKRPHSSAWFVDLSIGDEIVAIDQHHVHGMEMQDVLNLLLGQAGTMVSVEMRSMMWPQSMTRTLELERVPVCGVGVELGFKRGQVVVKNVDANTRTCGQVSAGMALLEVDNRDVADTPLSDVQAMLSGQRGTKVTLKLLDHETREVSLVALVREYSRFDHEFEQEIPSLPSFSPVLSAGDGSRNASMDMLDHGIALAFDKLGVTASKASNPQAASQHALAAGAAAPGGERQGGHKGASEIEEEHEVSAVWSSSSAQGTTSSVAALPPQANRSHPVANNGFDSPYPLPIAKPRSPPRSPRMHPANSADAAASPLPGHADKPKQRRKSHVELIDGMRAEVARLTRLLQKKRMARGLPACSPPHAGQLEGRGANAAEWLPGASVEEMRQVSESIAKSLAELGVSSSERKPIDAGARAKQAGSRSPDHSRSPQARSPPRDIASGKEVRVSRRLSTRKDGSSSPPPAAGWGSRRSSQTSASGGKLNSQIEQDTYISHDTAMSDEYVQNGAATSGLPPPRSPNPKSPPATRRSLFKANSKGEGSPLMTSLRALWGTPRSQSRDSASPAGSPMLIKPMSSSRTPTPGSKPRGQSHDAIPAPSPQKSTGGSTPGSSPRRKVPKDSPITVGTRRFRPGF
mmetsp:Transcript_43225/g.108223  ORF Transcript_43225/g.108223 Transcript_43225/m.108223 type:complete len:691 (+) Transcript_43225:120-2192(+)